MPITEEAYKALRAPFPPEAIAKLPRQNKKTGEWIELDYVGHAEVTDRLLSVDPEWSWEPYAHTSDGAPLIGNDGNTASMWIKLTICGVTRIEVGTARADAFDLEKQLVSDALRRGAMRFGIALDLWSKGGVGEFRNDDVQPDRPARGQQGFRDKVGAAAGRTQERSGPITIKEPGAPISGPQKGKLKAMGRGLGWDEERLLEEAATFFDNPDLENLDDLTKGDASSFIEELVARQTQGPDEEPF